MSTVAQNEARQLEALAGCERLFTDKKSGKDTERPALAEMLAYVRAGDTVRVSSLDRLARNVGDLRALVDTMTAKGVRVEFVKEALTFTGDDGAVSKLLLNLLGAVAEFERELIRERQAEGIAVAKANGVYRGRKPSLSPTQVTDARQRIASGVPKAVVARDLGVSRQTLYSALGAVPVLVTG